MPLMYVFWFLMLFALVAGFVAYPPTPNWRPFGYSLLLWLILLVLGIGVFGGPIRG
jgi:hypothetical protein